MLVTEHDFQRWLLLPGSVLHGPGGNQIAQYLLYFLVCSFPSGGKKNFRGHKDARKGSFKQLFSECRLEPATSKITWEPIRTAGSGALPQTADQHP